MLRRVLLLLLLLPQFAGADVVFDGSMGPAGVAPTRAATGFSTDYLIPYDERVPDAADRYGIRLGPNLFQSLDHLDLGLDERATFQAFDAAGNPLPGLERVIARITSGDASVIEGVLRSEVAGADLFLINPAGIDFRGRGGGRQQLDLQGGFAASTADFLRFDDGTRFDVSDTAGFTLSAAPVASFGFLGASRAEIRFDRAGLLQVPAGEDFSVVAGDVTFTGFASLDPSVPSERSDVRAPGSAIQLAAVGNAAVEVPVDVAQWAVRDAPEGTLGNVVVEAFSDLRATGGAGNDGRVVLRGGRLVVDDARVQAGGDGAGGLALDAEFADEIVARDDARLQVSGNAVAVLGGGRMSSRRVEVSGSGPRRTFVGSRPFGNTADPFVVEADSVLVTGAASLVTEVSGLAGSGGPGATLEVTADDITVSDGGEIGTRALTGAEGGQATVTAQRLTIDGGAVRSDNFLLAPDGSRIFGGGQAGDLEVNADELVMRNDGRIEALSGPAGDGGNIDVSARTIDMSGGSEINATTINDRDAGDVSVTASESLEIRGDVPFSPTGIFARSGESGASGLQVGSGDAGDLTVNAPILRMQGEAVLSNRSRGTGNPGSLRVTAGELTLTGDAVGSAEISARAQNGDTGGAIEIVADHIRLENGGAITAATGGRSPGGRISVVAESLTITGLEPTAGADSAAILSDTFSDAADAGDAGAVDIDLTGSLLVTDSGEIRAVTRGPGNAGTIDVAADVSVAITQGGSLSATALDGATGEAGNVLIAAPTIVIDGGSVTTEAANGTADGADVGGNIALTAGSELRIGGGSAVSARSIGDQDAGRIVIAAGDSLVIVDSDITTDVDEIAGPEAGGGQIDLGAAQLVELVRSRVTTSVQGRVGDEDGGDIGVAAPFVVINASDVLAQAVLGNGGNIDIVAQNYFESSDSTVDASSELGIDGSVNIDAPDSQLTGELARLPAQFLDAAALLREHCAARAAGSGSFIIAGTEGQPVAPNDALPATMPLPTETDGSAPLASVAAAPPVRKLQLVAIDCKALERAATRREVER